MIAKMFGSDKNYDVIINPDKGDLEIYRNRTVVADDDIYDTNTEIEFSDARKIDETDQKYLTEIAAAIFD